MATNKNESRLRCEKDFLAFWGFWLVLSRLAKSRVAADERGGELSISNRMMIAAYAANYWFHNKEKKGEK